MFTDIGNFYQPTNINSLSASLRQLLLSLSPTLEDTFDNEYTKACNHRNTMHPREKFQRRLEKHFHNPAFGDKSNRQNT